LGLQHSTKQNGSKDPPLHPPTLQIKNAATWLPQRLAEIIPKGILARIQFGSTENFSHRPATQVADAILSAWKIGFKRYQERNRFSIGLVFGLHFTMALF
jgi:hypothetical protein